MKLLRVILVGAVLAVTACSEPSFPKDPEGTLLRASDGELVVGVSPHAPHVEVSDDGAVTGSEADLVRGYAESIGASVEWVEGAESEVMEHLRLGHLDLAIGGFGSDTPWSTHAALTRPYATAQGEDGKQVKLVLAALLGENALLSSLERYLIDEGLQP